MQNTIKKGKQFQKVFHEGRRATAKTLRCCALKNHTSAGKVAFVAPKKLGCSVVRNRCKRRMRAAAQGLCAPFTQTEIIFFAIPQTKQATLEEITEDMRRLLQKVQVNYA